LLIAVPVAEKEGTWASNWHFSSIPPRRRPIAGLNLTAEPAHQRINAKGNPCLGADQNRDGFISPGARTTASASLLQGLRGA